MPKAAATRPKRRPPEQSAELRMAIHWRVDAASLRCAGHWEHAGDDVALTLALTVHEGTACAEATLSAGDRARGIHLPASLASARCAVCEAEGLIHIDAAPVLTATIEQCDRGRVLYARSGLLEFLGLAGGRYEVAGGCEGPRSD